MGAWGSVEKNTRKGGRSGPGGLEEKREGGRVVGGHGAREVARG